MAAMILGCFLTCLFATALGGWLHRLSCDWLDGRNHGACERRLRDKAQAEAYSSAWIEAPSQASYLEKCALLGCQPGVARAVSPAVDKHDALSAQRPRLWPLVAGANLILLSLFLFGG
jgi:hypothetical protein